MFKSIERNKSVQMLDIRSENAPKNTTPVFLPFRGISRAQVHYTCSGYCKVGLTKVHTLKSGPMHAPIFCHFSRDYQQLVGVLVKPLLGIGSSQLMPFLPFLDRMTNHPSRSWCDLVS